LFEETIHRAKVVVDSRETAIAEAGDLLLPIAKGLIGAGHIYADPGEIVNEVKPCRTGCSLRLRLTATRTGRNRDKSRDA